MPITVSSNLIPRNGAKWHVVEDTYVKGGFRVVANAAARDAIYTDATAKLTLKTGMLLVTADDGRVWQYSGAGVWTELKRSYIHTHEQTTPDTEWFIPHSMNSRFFTYTAFDNSGLQVMPNECVIVDNNNLILTFLEAISGTVTLTFNV